MLGTKLQWEGRAGCWRGKKPDWLESTLYQPSPAQPSLSPLATAADTCLKTYIGHESESIPGPPGLDVCKLLGFVIVGWLNNMHSSFIWNSQKLCVGRILRFLAPRL